MIILLSLYGDFFKFLFKLFCKWVFFNCYWNLYFFMYINIKICILKEGGVMYFNIIFLKEEWNIFFLLYSFFFGIWVNYNYIFFFLKYSCLSFKYLVKELDNNMLVISLKFIGGIIIVMFWYDVYIFLFILIFFVFYIIFNLEVYMYFIFYSYRK